MTSLAAVTGAMVVGGGMAGESYLHGHRNQGSAGMASAASGSDGVAQNVAARSQVTDQANRDAQRLALTATTAPSGPASGTMTMTSASPVAGTSPGASPSAATTTAAPAAKAPTTSAGPTATTSASASKPAATPTPTSSSASNGVGATPAQAKALAQQIVPSGQFQCFANIITRESGWNIHARNASSGAYGLPQALPGNKMGASGPDWQNNAVTQIKWALGYMNDRYGSPCGAWSFWQSHSWY